MNSKLFKDILLFAGALLLGFAIVISARYLYDLSQRQPAVIERDLSEHFIESNDKVVLYMTQWCSYCKKTKQLLSDLNISYTEYDIENSGQAVIDRYESLGKGVPKLLIGNILITGFHPDEIKAELLRKNIIRK